MGDRVFICYSRKDEDFVLKLASNLKNRGVPVWLDQWDIPSGANWNRTIEKALEESTRLLVILSPSSVASYEVECEWLPAIDAKKVVIPILYLPCQIPRQLKLIQYIDFTSSRPDDERVIGQILKALGMAGSTLIKPMAQKERSPEGLLNKPIFDSQKANNIPENTKSNEYKAETGKRGTNRMMIYGAITVIIILSLAFYLDRDIIFGGRPPSSYGVPPVTQNNQNAKNFTPVTQKLVIPVKIFMSQSTNPPKNNDDQSAVWLYKAVTFTNQSKYYDALQAWDKCIELSPEYGGYWFDKGYVLYQLDRYDAAIQALDKAIELNWNGGGTWVLRGLSLLAQGKYDEAIQDFNKSIEIDQIPYGDVWYYKGLARSAQGRYNEAIQAYDKATTLRSAHFCPDFPVESAWYAKYAWYNEGLAFQSLGRTTEANAALARAMELGYTS